MGNIVIKAEHLSKMYRLGTINNGTLWKDIQTWTALKLGKEDPHSKIGEDKYSGDDDHFWALKDLNFEIAQGDRVGIIGKNGAGKSTLLKILSRVTSPTEGTVRMRGRVSSLLEVGTGFNGELSGRENIYLNGAILGMKKRQIDRKLDEIIDFSEIEHHIDTPVKRYSSGMYVRLAFAVAAHLNSDILIADEVLAVGDASFQKKALGKMNDLSASQGRTVLFVSHNISAVRALCNTGILMDKGRILNQDALARIVEQYAQGDSYDRLETLPSEIAKHNKSEKVVIHSIHIGSSAIENGKIKINSPIDVTTEYFLPLDAKQCQISVHLLDSAESVIFASFNEQSVTENACEFHSRPFDGGTYSTICRIPAFFLNEGIYSINIFYIVNGAIEIKVERALVFEVFDTGEMRKEFVGAWVGSIRPRLYWDTKKV